MVAPAEVAEGVPAKRCGLCISCKFACEEAKSLLVGKLGAVLMPRDRSQDIDDEIDFTIVEAFIEENKRHEQVIAGACFR